MFFVIQNLNMAHGIHGIFKRPVYIREVVFIQKIFGRTQSRYFDCVSIVKLEAADAQH